jgi:uncharacterized alkaline shock family protein YloU
MTRQLSGKITIAPQVLTTIVEQTALDTTGVHALGPRPPRIRDAEGRRAVGAGAEAVVQDNTVVVAVSVMADPDVNMLALAETLQRDIAGNIEHILGMKVARVDVYIGEVVFSEETLERS